MSSDRGQDQERFLDILDGAPIVIYTLTGDGTVSPTYFSRYVEELTGHPPGAFLGSPDFWLAHLHPDDHARTIAALDKGIAETGGAEVDYRFRTADGRWVWIRDTARMRRDPDGQSLEIIGYWLDVTEARETNAALHAGQERLTAVVRGLEASNRDLEQFAYVAAHDLREPLRLVGSYLGLLKRRFGPVLDKEAVEYIDYATDAAVRMNRLVQDLLRFAIAGRGAPAERPRPLRDGLDAAITALRSRLDESGARVGVQTALPSTHLSLSDAEQIFEHLIDNAIKYRHPDRPPVVSVSHRLHADTVEIVLQDNGIGMDPAYADRVFQIFQRLHGWGDYPGTGIGLALAKKIIEARQGRIWLTSQPGSGTTVHFTVPRPRQEAAAEPPPPLPQPALR